MYNEAIPVTVGLLYSCHLEQVSHFPLKHTQFVFRQVMLLAAHNHSTGVLAWCFMGSVSQAGKKTSAYNSAITALWGGEKWSPSRLGVGLDVSKQLQFISLLLLSPEQQRSFAIPQNQFYQPVL